MLQWEHSAILSTFIKLPFVMKSFVLSIFEWPLKTGFTVHRNQQMNGKAKPVYPHMLGYNLIRVKDDYFYYGQTVYTIKTLNILYICAHRVIKALEAFNNGIVMANISF